MAGRKSMAGGVFRRVYATRMKRLPVSRDEPQTGPVASCQYKHHCGLFRPIAPYPALRSVLPPSGSASAEREDEERATHRVAPTFVSAWPSGGGGIFD